MNMSQVSQKYQLNQWISLVHECRNSGKTVAIWCAENDISRNAYYYWLRRVRKAACDSMPALSTAENAIVPVSFEVPKSAVQSDVSLAKPGITLCIGTVSLELHNGMSTELLTSTLKALNHVR